MKSSIVKRSVVIDGHKTSISLEDPFWTDLKKIAQAQRVTLSELLSTIDGARDQGNLSSAIRLFVLQHFCYEDKRMEAAKAQPFVGALQEHQQASQSQPIRDG
jgi:predicted DNA-binding ribbon-helix-helix protein